MSIRTKVIGCFLAILFLFAGVSLYGYTRSRESNARLALVNELFLPLSREIAQLQGNIQSLSDDMRRFYFHSELTTDASTFSRMVRDLYPYLIQKKFAALDRMLSREDHGGSQGQVADIASALQQGRVLFDKLTTSSEKAQFEASYQELRAQLTGVSRRVDNECQTITLAAQNEGRDNLISSLFLSTLVVLGGILTVMLSNRVLMPLPTLIGSIKKIADGDFGESLKVGSDKDEVATLAREYNRMLVALRARDAKIQLQQKELLQTERLAAIGQLSAEVVHEIRNPLNAISLNIDWLQSELTHIDPEVTKALKSLSREIERLNGITESYLVRARVPAHAGERTPVHDLLKEIFAFTNEEDRNGNIAIETELAPQEIFIRTDRSRLKQAFLNVLKNAKEAMPRGGKMTVRTEVRDNVYRIQFSDSGSGMNEVAKRNAFQPFFTTKTSGTGLGLMVTKEIVEEAHGSLQCESQLGRGTTFTFQFPV